MCHFVLRVPDAYVLHDGEADPQAFIKAQGLFEFVNVDHAHLSFLFVHVHQQDSIVYRPNL